MVEMVTKFPVKTETRPNVPGYAPSRPWYPFESLRRGIDRLFSDFDMGAMPTPFRRSFFDYEPYYAPYTKSATWPVVDVFEKPDGFEIKAELPGVDEKDIEVKAVEGGLWIKGLKREEKHEKQGDYVASERSYGSFERFFGLPEGIETDKIAATFAKGILTVALPKTHEAKQQERKIAVKAA